MQGNDTWRRLYESGILMQANASFFKGMFSRRRAFEMLRGGGIHFIGSDCHNTTSRAPDIGAAYSLIEKKLGYGCLEELDLIEKDLLPTACR